MHSSPRRTDHGLHANAASNRAEDAHQAASRRDGPHADAADRTISLIGVYTSNQWCRQLLFSTVDFTSDDAFRFLNVGLELSPAYYALLSTLTFNALFAACSLAAGALVDRADAVKLTYVSCGLWALATVATAYTSSFAGVAACRALQGVAMAATAPAGYALLGRAFPPDKLATASSRYAAAVSAGGALAAVSTRLDDAIGWRGAFAVAGASSLVVALIAFLLLPAEIGPPLNPETKELEEGGFGGVFASKAAVALLAATAVRFAAGFTIGVWAIPCLASGSASPGMTSGAATRSSWAFLGLCRRCWAAPRPTASPRARRRNEGTRRGPSCRRPVHW